MNRKLLALTTALAITAASRLEAQGAPTGRNHEITPEDPYCWSAGSTAQSCNFSLPVRVTIPHLLELWTNETETNFGMIDFGGFADGPQLYAWANTDWDVTLTAGSDRFTDASGAPTNKPMSELYVYSSTIFSSLYYPVTLQTGGRGYTQLAPFQFYTFTDPYSDAPGDYVGSVVYTMTGR